MDAAGVVTSAGALVLLVVPLVLGREERWPVWGWVALAASAGMGSAFVGIERRIARSGLAPLVSGRVLQAPGLTAAAVAMLLALLNYGGFLFTFALHLQSGLGESAQRAGLTFAPMAAGFAATGLTWRRLPARLHGPLIPAGLCASALGCLILAVLLRGGTSGGFAALALLGGVGLALGLAFSPMIAVALAHVPLSDAADASGVLVTVFQLGQVVGVATLGTLYLALAHNGGAAASAHALAITLGVLAAVGLAAAGCALASLRSSTRAADSSAG
jgi:hypothetical protein